MVGAERGPCSKNQPGHRSVAIDDDALGPNVIKGRCAVHETEGRACEYRTSRTSYLSTPATLGML